jgi:hypothetical protein
MGCRHPSIRAPLIGRANRSTVAHTHAHDNTTITAHHTPAARGTGIHEKIESVAAFVAVVVIELRPSQHLVHGLVVAAAGTPKTFTCKLVAPLRWG